MYSIDALALYSQVRSGQVGSGQAYGVGTSKY